MAWKFSILLKGLKKKLDLGKSSTTVWNERNEVRIISSKLVKAKLVILFWIPSSSSPSPKVYQRSEVWSTIEV